MSEQKQSKPIFPLELASNLAEACPDLPSELVAGWRAYLAPLMAKGMAMAEDEPDRQAVMELYRQLYSGLSMAFMGLFLGDAEHPDFWPLINQAYNFLAPNPDDTYLVAPLAGDGVYKISGFRGTVFAVDLQIGTGTLFTRGGNMGPNFGTHDLDDLQIGPDGAFEVILSAERPAGYQGNWCALGDNVTHVLIRQASYDWLSEVDGRFAIERLDRPAIRPRLNAARIEADLRCLATWAENWTMTSMQRIRGYRAQGLVNRCATIDLSDVGGVAGHYYIEGQFEFALDEAIIYETELPATYRYWNVQVNDMLWATIDYTNRQSSLNGHMARLDADGQFRAVISAVDPGVPNWLDSSGVETGTIIGRWNSASSAPLPRLTRVKLSALRQHLPPETPVISAAERDQILRQRRKGIQLRRRW